jgi:transcriptional regulator with XRE-family HTH domain
MTPDSDYVALERALAGLRRKAGKTQIQSARIVGVRSTYVSQLERGLRAPSWRPTFALLRSYGATLADLAREGER